MARKSRKRPAPVARTRSYQPQDVFLAGLGAVAIGRRQVASAVAHGPERVAELRSAAQAAVRRAGKSVSARVVSLRRQAAPVQAAIESFARDARRGLEARLAPALAKLGVKAPAARRAKPAPRRAKPVARRRMAA
jgi:hypothetical protein